MKKEQKKRRGCGGLARSSKRQQHSKGWVPIQAPPKLDQMFQHWIDCEEPNVGWCLLCDSPIRSAEDMIPGTNSHNCEAGRAMDEKIRAAERASETDRKVMPARRQREP